MSQHSHRCTQADLQHAGLTLMPKFDCCSNCLPSPFAALTVMRGTPWNSCRQLLPKLWQFPDMQRAQTSPGFTLLSDCLENLAAMHCRILIRGWQQHHQHQVTSFEQVCTFLRCSCRSPGPVSHDMHTRCSAAAELTRQLASVAMLWSAP